MSPIAAALLLIVPPASAVPGSRYTSCSSIETPRGSLIIDRLPYMTFESGSARITSRAAATLDAFVADYDAPLYCEIVIDGHADRVGPADRNLRLSERRANAVAAYLRRRGITAPIVVNFYGDSRPLVETADEVAEPQNRQVSIWINDPRPHPR